MADPESFAGTDRFVVQRRLGAGSFGVVYDVLDRERNTSVALKTLRVGTGRTLYRFKQEFRALADVSHPNLVTLYELLSDGGQWFFTMERIDGVTFLEHVRGAASWPSSSGFSSPTTPELDLFLREGSPPGSSAHDVPHLVPSAAAGPSFLERLRPALVQLAQGVCALHAAGKLHRDIKPSNVLVTRDGRVVLLDFGLVHELRPSLTRTVDAVGTPAYMSPEQASERPLTEASDWYSVGVMLYESLTGTLPFSGPALDVLRRKQLEEPPTPGTLVPEVPEELDVLCRSLLHRVPGQRPSGAEFLRRLRRLGPAAPEVVSDPPPPVSPAALVPFVGRAAELARLREAYARTRAGQPTTVVVHGGSGMGKSALVRRFLDEIRTQAPPPMVLSGRCYERESVPYKALDSIIDALSQHLRRLAPGTVEALLPHDVIALARLFPVLRQVPAVTRARRTVLEIPDSQELRRRAFGALRELLVRLADRWPVVIVIDDLQWGDADSAALLLELMKPPDSPTVLIIGCYRTEDAAASPLLSVLLPLRESVPATAINRMDMVLGELTAEEARTLAADLLGQGAPDAGRAEAIARESQGNPFLIDALSRFAPEDSSGARLDELIRRRAGELTAAARQLLHVVAIAARPIELAVAFPAAGLDHDGDAALAALRAVHFVRTRRSTAGDEIETYHDRLRAAVVAGLTADEIRGAHERLAAALVASGRADPERLAEHFREAGHLSEAAHHATVAADSAARALAFDRAARLYRLSLDLQPTPSAEGQRLTVQLADALANAGRGREAAAAYLAARAGAATYPEQVDLTRRAAPQLLIAGHVDEGLRLVKEVLASVGFSMARSTRQALVSLMLRRALLRLRGLGFRRRDAARLPPWDLLRIDTCWSVAVGLGHLDMVGSADFQTRSLQLALRAGEPHRVARGLALEATFVSMGGTRTRARTERLLAAANALATELGDEHALGLAAMSEGVAAWIQGRWKDARRLCDEAAAILRERYAGATWETDNAEMYALAALFMLGEIGELSRRLPRLLERAQERGNLLVATHLRLGYYSHVAWLAADDPEGARREIEQGLATRSESVFDFIQLWLRGARRDIALYTGEGLETAAPVARGWRGAARILDHFAQAGLILSLFSRARRRVALAAAAGTAAEAAAHLEEAGRHVRGMRKQRTAWGDALALLVEGGASATRGDRGAAARGAAEAASRLAGADMALFAAAARRSQGQAQGGVDGERLVAEADAWMTAQSIRRPDRMARMLAPGAWAPR